MTWSHHRVEYPIPVVNGIVVNSVPRWVTAGIKSFATYGSVSYGKAYRIRMPHGYVLEMRDPYQTPAQVCLVELMIVDDGHASGEPLLVVHAVELG